MKWFASFLIVMATGGIAFPDTGEESQITYGNCSRVTKALLADGGRLFGDTVGVRCRFDQDTYLYSGRWDVGPSNAAAINI